MKILKKLLFFALIGLFSFSTLPEWGFYGHRKINRLAVFTLPQELIGFYKKNIEYITSHAVDPDKRRYALKNEFARHYIDIDHWDTIPFNNVPKEYSKAVMKFGELKMITGLDTTVLDLDEENKTKLYDKLIYDFRYDVAVKFDHKLFPFDSFDIQKPDNLDLFYFDNLMVQYGIHPYFLEEYYKRLSKAFFDQNWEYVLKISADIGHYIGDGHVPLHTTENYNGQLTNQIGIHAFWESRLPELYADEKYDFIVGKAIYIKDIREYIWDFIEESHALLPAVLEKEKLIKSTFPEDRQFCFDERLEVTTRIQCKEYCDAYHEALGGMVEMRMQDAVLAIGSFWYSAWIDAGQPSLPTDITTLNVVEEKDKKALDDAYKAGNNYGRKHQ